MGRVRAKQTDTAPAARQSRAIVMHGDRLRGQGIWQRRSTWRPAAYTVGGTIHIIVNNLIALRAAGARTILAVRLGHCKRQYVPVFHVNGEDPDASCALAVGRRLPRPIWQRRVVDIIGYRRHVIAKSMIHYYPAARLRTHQESCASLAHYSERIGVQPMQIVENVRKEYEEEQTKARAIRKIPQLRKLPEYWSPTARTF